MSSFSLIDCGIFRKYVFIHFSFSISSDKTVGLMLSRCLINLGFLPHYSPTPPLKKVSASPHISSKATWLCLLGFIGELGKGAEGEKVKKDGLSHKGWNCPGPKNSSPVCY